MLIATERVMISRNSIWRTYFVANEWNELQSLRKINTRFLLLAVIFFFYVADAESLALGNPSSEYYKGTTSYIFRFAVFSILFLAIGAVLYIWSLIHDRFVEDKIGQFTDLCSLSNISVFILKYQLYG